MVAFQRYLVLTPFAQAEVLAEILKIRKLEAKVEATESGVIIYRDLPVKEYTDWDIAELVGATEDNTDETKENEIRDSTFAPDEEFSSETAQDPLYVAKAVSLLSPYGVILFTAELGDNIGGETGVSGLVHALRVVNGEAVEEIAPGVVLAVLDQRIEDLLLSGTENNTKTGENTGKQQ